MPFIGKIHYRKCRSRHVAGQGAREAPCQTSRLPNRAFLPAPAGPAEGSLAVPAINRLSASVNDGQAPAM
jgi:hypothetical protein